MQIPYLQNDDQSMHEIQLTRYALPFLQRNICGCFFWFFCFVFTYKKAAIINQQIEDNSTIYMSWGRIIDRSRRKETRYYQNQSMNQEIERKQIIYV